MTNMNVKALKELVDAGVPVVCNQARKTTTGLFKLFELVSEDRMFEVYMGNGKMLEKKNAGGQMSEAEEGEESRAGRKRAYGSCRRSHPAEQRRVLKPSNGSYPSALFPSPHLPGTSTPAGAIQPCGPPPRERHAAVLR